jgi:predicted RNase H-like nuclease (RuvC/YqgF family)
MKKNGIQVWFSKDKLPGAPVLDIVSVQWDEKLTEVEKAELLDFLCDAMGFPSIQELESKIEELETINANLENDLQELKDTIDMMEDNPRYNTMDYVVDYDR